MAEDTRRLRLHHLWRSIGFGLVAAILVLSFMPIPTEADLGENSDKLGHFLMYGSVMFWFGLLYPARRRQIAIALAFCAMGVGIEFLQGMTDYRSFELADMAANSVGVAIGWSVALTPLKHSLAWIEGLMLQSGKV